MSRGLFPRVRRYGLLYLRTVEYDQCLLHCVRGFVMKHNTAFDKTSNDVVGNVYLIHQNRAIYTEICYLRQWRRLLFVTLRKRGVIAFPSNCQDAWNGLGGGGGGGGGCYFKQHQGQRMNVFSCNF